MRNNKQEQQKKILFLYFELAGYVIACMEKLRSDFPVQLHVINYPVNNVAPFQFEINPEIQLYNRIDFDNAGLLDLVDKIQPDLLYVCGWSDKGYIAVCRHINKKIPVILTLDNPWLATIKQRAAAIAGPLFLKRLFTHCWVPGEPNAVYARKLGFKNNQLITGMYSADTDLFHHYYDSTFTHKRNKFPHRFIFMGRYTKLKGVQELWKAFESFSDDERKDWELWCLGKGELIDDFPNHPSIKDFGFVQPTQLEKFIKDTGVFLLPAHYEHWGVAVHEFAAAGFPLICSKTTSAATVFLEEGINGYFCEPESTTSIKECMLKIMNQTDEQLTLMGIRSYEMSSRITTSRWAKTLWDLTTLN